MSMPQIPDAKFRPTFDETIIDLLESIALEEIAISHILNSEGEKMQSLIKKYTDKELCVKELNTSFKATRDMINSLIMKEWLLYNKMNTIMELQKEISHKYDDDCDNDDNNWDDKKITSEIPHNNEGRITFSSK